jgi:hypothetical protein
MTSQVPEYARQVATCYSRSANDLPARRSPAGRPIRIRPTRSEEWRLPWFMRARRVVVRTAAHVASSLVL